MRVGGKGSAKEIKCSDKYNVLILALLSNDCVLFFSPRPLRLYTTACDEIFLPSSSLILLIEPETKF